MYPGLYGAARAAELSRDWKKAKSYYATLVALCENANGDRPELRRAKGFLATK